MNSNHKLYARFHIKTEFYGDSLSMITILPVLFWVEVATLDYIAMVPYPTNGDNVNMRGRALPVDSLIICETIGKFIGFIDDSEIHEIKRRMLEWVSREGDGDNRSFQIFPNVSNV